MTARERWAGPQKQMKEVGHPELQVGGSWAGRSGWHGGKSREGFGFCRHGHLDSNPSSASISCENSVKTPHCLEL